MLKNNYLSHWGTDGLKPYMRYTKAGGSNYESENVHMTTITSSVRKVPSQQMGTKENLHDAERSLMVSSGHRSNILNRWHSRVNLGLAYDERSLLLVQQFEGGYITFTDLPRMQGSSLLLAGKTQPGFGVETIQVFYDPPPRPLAPGHLRQTFGYGFGKAAVFVRPPAGPGYYYRSSVAAYTFNTYVDPYSIPAGTPESAPHTASPRTTPATQRLVDTVWFVDAKRWDITPGSFAVEADLSQTLGLFGKGVYTVVVWSQAAGEYLDISNYSIFVQ